MVPIVKPWQEYQHQVAGLLQELGFSVEVEPDFAEPNDAVHVIDVAARRTIAGVDVLWIVECKYWSRRVPIEKVLTLEALVRNLGADRGLFMSESGYQSGAIRTAAQKNITLSSLDDLRLNADSEILAVRVTAVERRVLTVTQKLIRDLRTFSSGLPHVLPIMASRLSSDDRAELAARAEPPDFFEGVLELAHRIGAAGIGDFVPPGTDLSKIERAWKDGLNPVVMEAVSGEINQISQAMDQGKLGNWPIVALAATGAKLTWGMRQLLQVVESRLAVVEQMVGDEERKLTR